MQSPCARAMPHLNCGCIQGNTHNKETVSTPEIWRLVQSFCKPFLLSEAFSTNVKIITFLDITYKMKSTKVLNPRLITPKTMHEHMIMQHVTVDTIKSIKTGTSLQDYGIIELWQKYSSTLHACSVTTQGLLLQVKDHQSKQRLSAESACN